MRLLQCSWDHRAWDHLPDTSSVVFLASFSNGGPSFPTSMNWICLCGWLAPLFGPPDTSFKQVPCNVSWEGTLTVVKGDEMFICLASSE